MLGDLFNNNRKRDVCTREGQRMYMGKKYSTEEATGYLVCTTGRRRRLHDVIFEKENSCGIDMIPDGYVVHHIDWDKTHNEIKNLTLVSVEGHNLIHNRRSGEIRQVKIVPGGISEIINN